MNGMTTFLNLQTDFGFKRIFGTERNKNILIRFLTAILGEGIRIDNVVYHDKEVLPGAIEGKRIIYDIYCTVDVAVPADEEEAIPKLCPPATDECIIMKQRHHFILEMQNIYAPPFEDRILFYTAKAVSEQGQRGWGYTVQPVVTVVVTDFDFKHMSPSIMHDVRLMDKESGDVFTDKFRMVFLSLKKIGEKTWEECTTELERLLYLIKNMDTMDKNSKPYVSGEYRDLFEASETQPMASDEMVAYSQSLDKLQEVRKAIDYERSQAMTAGLRDGYKEGREQGRAEGMEQGRIEGMEQGLAEGKQQGLAEGKQQGLAEGKQQGLAEGKQQGLAEGKQQGLAEGKQQGLAEGKQQGLAEGKQQEKIKIALIMKSMGIGISDISKITGLSTAVIQNLHN